MASRAQLELQVQMDGADKAQKALSGMSKEAGVLGKAMGKLKGGLGSVGGGIGKLGGGFTSLLGPVGLASAGFVGLAGVLGKQFLDAANESEAVTAQLRSVLTSTAGKAGVTEQAALDLADALSSKSGLSRFSDEAVLSAENMLLTFTNIGRDVFPEATQTVLDMSQALGQDLSASSVQLGKALNDPIKGITALSRVGVTFTDQQKEQIETLVKSGKTMDAQKIILAELATEFGGSASAAAQTFAGRMQTVQERVGDVAERLGGALMPHLDGLLNWLASPEVSAGIDAVADGLEKGMAFAFDALGKAGSWALDNVIKPVWNFFQDATVQQTIRDIGAALLDGLGKGWEFLMGLGTGIWSTIEGAIRFLGGSSDTGTAIKNIGEALGGALKTGWEWISNAAAGIWSTIEGAIRFLGGSDNTSTAISNIGNALGGALKTGWEWIETAAVGIWDTIEGAIQFLGGSDSTSQSITNIGNAIGGALKGGWDALMSAGTWAWDNAIKPFFEFLQQPEVKAAVLSIAGAIGGLLRDAWLAVEKPATAAWNAMSKIFGDMKDPKNREEMEKLAKVVETALAVQFGVLAAVASAVGSAVQSASGALTDFFELIEGKGEEFTSFINNLMNLTPAGIVLPDIKTPDQWAEEAKAGGEKIAEGVLGGFNDIWSAVAEGVFITAGESVPTGTAEGVTKGAPVLVPAITGMVDGIVDLANDLLNSHSPSKVFQTIGEGIPAGLGLGVTGNQAAATGPMGALIAAIKGLAQGQLTSAAFNPFGAAVGAGIAGGITSTSGAATGAAAAMTGAIKTNVATADDGAFSVGSAIPAGVAAGINAGASKAIGAAASMARGALKAAKDALGIASPSKEFHIMGEDSAEGYEEGWWSKAPEVAKTTAAVVTMGKDAADKALGTGTTAPYHIMGEDHIQQYEDGWWSGSKSLNMTIDELRHSALGRLANLPEDDLRAIQDSGGIATDAFKEGVEKGWSSGKGRSLEQIIHDAACGSATKAAQVVDECGELVGDSLMSGTGRGIDKNAYKAKDAWDAYNKYVVDAHKAAADQIEKDMAFLAQATIDHLAMMEEGIVRVGNAVSGANAYTYGAGNGAESPGSTGSGRRVIPQAAGGDWMVRKPTLFLAGEAGPERATFTPVGKAGPGAGTVNVYIGTVTTPNAREFVDQLDQELMRSQRLRTAAVGVPG
jgi:hypothetical protein